MIRNISDTIMPVQLEECFRRTFDWSSRSGNIAQFKHQSNTFILCTNNKLCTSLSLSAMILESIFERMEIAGHSAYGMFS